MTTLTYEEWNPGGDALAEVIRARAIVEEYRSKGYSLTLRQLYYQFVARDYIPNTERSYKRLGNIISRARMSGYLDWEMVEDRTRSLAGLSHWNDPAEIIRGAAASFRFDRWSDQDTRVEVWVEKEALAGVVQRAANEWDVDYFSCRGYVSQSELWRAGTRVGDYIAGGQRVLILHLGDHDPSGIDMTRDIKDRLELFVTGDAGRRLGWHPPLDERDAEATIDDLCDEFNDQLGEDQEPAYDLMGDLLEVRRIALNMDQVREWAPPPNPAKMTDSRAGDYVDRFGRQSWELDALPPETLHNLISNHIAGTVDMDRYEARLAEQEREREVLTSAAARWPEVKQFLEGS